MNFLNTIDIFGNKFQFNVSGKETFNTRLGGACSLIIIFTGLILSWYFGQDLYLKVNPKYLVKTRYKNYTPMLKLNTTTFFFGIRVEDDDGKLVEDPRLFTFSFNSEMLSGSKEGFSISLNNTYQEAVRCSSYYFDKETLIDKDITGFYCANFTDLSFGGDWYEDYIARINYFIKKCDHNTEKKYNIKCANSTEIKKTVGNFWISYFAYQTIVDPKNYSYPIRKLYENQYTNLDMQNTTNYFRFFYSVSEVQTDSGIIFSDINNKEFLTLDYLTTNSLVKEGDNSIAKMQFFMNKKNVLYIREYYNSHYHKEH